MGIIDHPLLDCTPVDTDPLSHLLHLPQYYDTTAQRRHHLRRTPHRAAPRPTSSRPRATYLLAIARWRCAPAVARHPSTLLPSAATSRRGCLRVPPPSMPLPHHGSAAATPAAYIAACSPSATRHPQHCRHGNRAPATERRLERAFSIGHNLHRPPARGPMGPCGSCSSLTDGPTGPDGQQSVGIFSVALRHTPMLQPLQAVQPPQQHLLLATSSTIAALMLLALQPPPMLPTPQQLAGDATSPATPSGIQASSCPAAAAQSLPPVSSTAAVPCHACCLRRSMRLFIAMPSLPPYCPQAMLLLPQLRAAAPPPSQTQQPSPQAVYYDQFLAHACASLLPPLAYSNYASSCRAAAPPLRPNRRHRRLHYPCLPLIEDAQYPRHMAVLPISHATAAAVVQLLRITQPTRQLQYSPCPGIPAGLSQQRPRPGPPVIGFRPSCSWHCVVEISHGFPHPSPCHAQPQAYRQPSPLPYARLATPSNSSYQLHNAEQLLLPPRLTAA
jgi:hypothetical protein